MRFTVSSLEDISFREIHVCFAVAFADYAVTSAVMDEAALQRRARKNDWQPELSAGIWAEDGLVAVSLTGLDDIGGERLGYDICTGVVPEHRGQGLAGMMMDAMVPGLQKAGAAALQLEVLQSNGEGIRAYEKAGFTITRALVSHAGPIEAVKPADGRSPVRPIGLDELRQLTAQLDFEPSYEQRDSAIAHLQDELLMIGAFEHDRCISAAAFDPATRWIMRMVTHRDFRRQGWASSLLFEAIRQLMDSSVLKAVNIDERDGATRSLMDACGLGESIRQWEMRLEL